MCGIQGFFTPQKKEFTTAFTSDFRQALELIKYRGPDGEGLWSNSNVMLGHRRLSIIDLSSDGLQPMTKDGLTIIYNGEIYNYIELRAELDKLGVVTKTATDTEVILNAYKTWGTDCFNRFNGMWAIAIWDENRGELILSRDRFGVKPLYFSVLNDGLYFASEMKQLLKIFELSGKKADWNAGIVADFNERNLLHHSVETMYAEIFAMRPAHFLKLNREVKLSADKIIPAMTRYWDFPTDESGFSFTEAVGKLRELFFSAVNLRLRSDVPVGSALSGGIDSSAIVAAIAELKPMRQKTFSASFPGDVLDERRYAEMVVAGKNIEAIYTVPDSKSLERDFSDLIFHQDGAFFSTSMYAQWEVYRAAAKNDIRVMLDGQGADEVFGGYEGFLRSHVKSVKKNTGIFSAVIEGAHFIANHRSYFISRIRARKKNLQTSAASSDRKLWFGPEKPKYADPLKENLYRAVTCTSLPALLMFADRSSMAFSIESRTPYLDYRIVEFAFRCPSSFHMRNGQRKVLLREAFKGLIPEAIRTRNDKIGFAAPASVWSGSRTVKEEVLSKQPWVI